MRTELRALLVSSALLVAACTPMERRDGPDGMPPQRGETDRGASGPSSASGQFETQLQQAADALALTPAQTVLWDAYVEQIGALMADRMKLQSRTTLRQSAPQQIARKVEVVRNRLTAMEDILQAADKLYAALDEEQRKTADRVLPPTVPALYSGFGGDGATSGAGGSRSGERPGGPGRPGGTGGPGGGMAGGFGRM